MGGGRVRGIGGKGIEVWAQLLTEDIEVNPNCMTHREMNKITNPNYFNQLRLDEEPKKIEKIKIKSHKRKKEDKNYKYRAQSHDIMF